MTSEPLDHHHDLPAVCESELLVTAARCGADVSPTQLKRLRMVGLVVRPTQDHPAGVRGSVALYPARAVKQLCDLVAFRGERRLDHLVLLVWWNGLDVTPADARAAAVRVLDRMSTRFARLLAEHEDPFEAAEALAADATGTRSRSRALKLMRRRLGNRDDLISVLTVLGSLSFGAEIAWDVSDSDERSLAALVNRAWGVERATSDRIGDTAWLDEAPDTPRLLGELEAAGAFDVRDVAAAIRDADDAAFVRARANARLLNVDLPALTRMMELVYGDDVGGLGSFQAFREPTAEPDAIDLALYLRMACILERVLGESAFEGLHRLTAEQLPNALAFAAVHDRLPQHREVVRTVLLGDEPDANVFSRFQTDLRALLCDDPEFARALRPLIDQAVDDEPVGLEADV